MWAFLAKLIQALVGAKTEPMTQTTPTPPIAPPASIPEATRPLVDLLMPWTGTPNNRHNVRVLCDLEGLTYDQKEVLAACVMVESGFKTNITHPNYVFVGGVRKIASTDYGICQWNDYYHGSEITPSEAINDPEKAVRLMCQYWLAGKMSQWVSYSSGAYTKWLGKV